MIELSPERKGTQNPLTMVADTGFRFIMGIGFNEWREWKQTKQRSRKYVDAIFDCYTNGVITGSQLKAKLPPLLEDEEYTRLGINRHEVSAWAFHRTVSLYLDGYVATLEAD